jgi:hypothetical protein
MALAARLKSRQKHTCCEFRLRVKIRIMEAANPRDNNWWAYFGRPAKRVAGARFAAGLLVASLGASRLWAADIAWQGPDSGDWNTGVNWAGSAPPDAALDEAAVISNSTTVMLSDHAKSGSFPPLVNVNVGGLRLGTVAGTFGGLRITNGGNLPNVATASESGAIEVGVAGRGELRVFGGGTISGTSLSLGGAMESGIRLGDASGLVATLNVDGTADLQRTTTVFGPNVQFRAGGNLMLGSASTLVANIFHPANHSALKTEGSASVSGTFTPIFTGVTPTLGNRWNLIDAATGINGAFTSVDSSMAPVLGGDLRYQLIQTTSGARRILQLVIARLGDFNGDNLINAGDIDLLCEELNHGGADDKLLYDVNGDNQITMSDLTHEVQTIIGTDFGDTDTDGDVDLADLGNLATGFGQPGEKRWARGNFDCDDDVDLNDLGTLASNFEGGRDAALAAFEALVPEPAAGMLAFALLPGMVRRSRLV